MSEFFPEMPTHANKRPPFYSEGEIETAIRLTQIKRACSEDGSSHAPPLYPMARFNSDDKDTCDTSSKVIAEEAEEETVTYEGNIEDGTKVRITLIDQKTQDFNPQEIATMLNENSLKQQISEIDSPKEVTVELPSNEDGPIPYPQIISSCFNSLTERQKHS